MGNLYGNGTSSASSTRAPIYRFYASSSWIEGKAEDQLTQISKLTPVQQVAAFPDLHPGKWGPVGCAVLSKNIHPQLIGNDIGCGMSVFKTTLNLRKFRQDKAAARLRILADPANEQDAEEMLQSVGLEDTPYVSSLGSIGGGNHFCEVQILSEVLDPALAEQYGIRKGDVLFLVHSGSRGYGMSVFEGHVSAPATGYDPASERAVLYLHEHDKAVNWASANRRLIAERAATALRCDLELLADTPHNLIEPFRGSYLHRKGAARAEAGLVPLAGSRDTLSYLLHTVNPNPAALSSLAHGAGRKYDRASMVARLGTKKSAQQRLLNTDLGGRVICEDKKLLIEEAPQAYKSSVKVFSDLCDAKLAQGVASLRPLITFKRVQQDDGGQV